MNIDQEKEKIRAAMRAELLAQTDRERANKSAQVAAKLIKIGTYDQAKTILFYSAIRGEVDTRTLMERAIERKKNVLLPCVDQELGSIKPYCVQDLNKDLVSGSYGIMEPNPKICKPIPLDAIDLVLVPGLAFDQAKFRLGRGKGYYDKFLSKLPRHVATIGLAFDFQVLEALPVTELDIPVNRVVHN